jgi:ABC-type branched-subunit amino acid transport system ATPase component
MSAPKPEGSPAPVLELDRLSLSFGGLRALSELDLGVGEREIVSLIGPNGAGKTTVFNVITGVYEPNSGDVRFAGRSIAGLAPHSVARLGIARTFQSLRLFLNMSVLENVMAATYGNTRAMPWESMLRLPRARREEREVRALAEDVLSFFGQRLAGYRWEQPAYSLSYANRRRLEIARALATSPRLLLLDEPAAGMNPAETHEITELISRLRDEREVAILVIEHDMHVVDTCSDRVVALDHGGQDRRGRLRPGGRPPGGRRGLPGPGPGRAVGCGVSNVLLSLENVTTYYAQMRILEGISLNVGEGELVCLLGGNASGKSTTLKTILGIVRPRTGRVLLGGKDVTQWPVPQRISAGIAIVPENRRLFGQMTVRENLELGAVLRGGEKLDDDFDRVHTLFPRLYERRSQLACTLSGGEQQMVAMGRALMSRPRLLLMDEPSMGLSPALV